MKNLIAILALCLSVPFLTQAQTDNPEKFELENLPTFTKNYQFGIMLDLNNSMPSLQQHDLGEVGLSDLVNSVGVSNGYGISLGMLYGYEFNDFLTVRAQAMLSFLESSYVFDLNDEIDETLKRETLNLEFPVHLVIENVTKKVSPSAVFGGRYRHNFSNNTLTSRLSGNYNTSNFLLDVGAGISFKFDEFRFKTELLYSHGLVNQIGENEPLSLPTAIRSINDKQLSLRFMFYM